jgi:hypothetical protein
MVKQRAGEFWIIISNTNLIYYLVVLSIYEET